MIKNIKVFLVLFLLISQQSNAQIEKVIRGKVESDGKALAFVSVRVIGANNGTVTDLDGNFSIKLKGDSIVKLEFALLGYRKELRRVKLTQVNNSRLLINLFPAEHNTSEVVISGTMKEISYANSPIAIEIITPKFFAKNKTATVFDALQLVNGVRPQINCNVCNTGDIHINGMEGPYTMIVIDGMPIVSSLSTVYGLSGIPNSVIERIEIIRGPSSALYGSEAIGGLINIITKAPAENTALDIESSMSSHLESNTDVIINSAISKNASMLLSLNYFRYQALRDVNNDGFTDITLQNRVSLFNKWVIGIRKNKQKMAFAIRYLSEDRWGGETRWNSTFKGGDSIYAETIRTNRIELIGNYPLLKKEKLTLQYSWNLHDQKSYYGIKSFNAKQQVAFAQFLYDKRINVRNDFLAGLCFRYNFFDDNTFATTQTENNILKNKPNQSILSGLFIQNEYSITEHQQLVAAARVDVHSVHGLILTPRLNYKLQIPQSNDVIRVGIGNGYRVVNIFTEDHAALTGAREVVISEQLNPEQSWNISINHSKFFNHQHGFITTDLGLFYTFFTNRILANYDADPNEIRYQNLDGYAISRGMNLNVNWNFKIPLKLTTGVSFLDVYSKNKNAQGDLIRIEQYYSSPISGNFLFNYQFKKSGITIDYTGNFYSPMALPVLPNDYRDSHSPWYSIQNIQVNKIISKQWEVYVSMKNVLNFIPKDPIMRAFDPFDKHISENNPNGYTFDPNYMYAPIQGRRMVLGITYKWRKLN